MSRTRSLSLLVAASAAFATASVEPPGPAPWATEEQQERIARIQQLGGGISRVSFPPFDEGKEKPKYLTWVVAYERESLAEKMAAILPLLDGFPGEHHLAMQAAEWTDSCLGALRLVRDLDGLGSVSVACWKRPAQAETAIRRALPRVPPDQISVEKLSTSPRPRRVSPGGDELQHLRVERYNHAVEAHRIRNAHFMAGTQQATLEYVLAAQESTYAAALDLCETAEERVVILELWLETAKVSEAIVEARANAGLRSGTAESLLAARFHRLDVEVRLQEAYDTTGLRPGRGKLLGILNAGLPKAPELGDVRLLAAELRPTGALHLVALVADERERAALATWANDALLLAVDRGYLRPDHHLERFDLAGVRVGSSARDELLAIESLLPPDAAGVVRLQRLDRRAGEIALAGVVETAAVRDALVHEMGRVSDVRHVEAGNLLVRQPEGAPATALSGLRTDALDALGRNDGERVLQATAALVRHVPSGLLAVEAWYLRAAGHLLLGRRQDAIGDLRVAEALARPLGGYRYHALLERFQGPARIALSDLVEAGAQAAIVR